MRKAWPVVPMGELCSISSGESDTQDAVADGHFAFFDRSKTIKRSSRFLYDCEALIIPGEGKEFLPRQFQGKFDLHQRAYALFDFNPQIDVRFLYHLLHYRADYFPSVAVGATVKSLRRRHFEQLPVPVPPLYEQRRIATLLDEAVAALDTAKANAEKNLQNTRALFESQLDLVFTTLSKKWKGTLLGELAAFRNGLNFTQQSKGERIKIIGVRDFHNNFYAPLDDLDTVTIDGKLNEQDALKEGDILAVRSNGNIALIGRTLLVRAPIEKTSHSGFTIRIRLADSSVLPEYLCQFMKSGRSRRQLVETGTGTNIKSLNQAGLAALTIPCPPLAEQTRIVEQLRRLSAETQGLDRIYGRKLVAIEELKKSLLHQAFTGHLH